MILSNKVKSTFMVDGEVYKRIRILAIERNMEVSALIEEAMREKLEREFSGYQPPQPQPQPQTQRQKSDRVPSAATENKERISKTANYARGAAQQSQLQLDSRITNLAEHAHKAGGYEILLPGLKFPIDEEGLLEYAEGVKGDALPIFRALKTPDNKDYNDVSLLEDDVSKVFNRLLEVVEYKRKQGISEMIKLKINTKKEKTLDPGFDDYLQGRFHILLPRIEYPLNKEAIIQHVKKFQNEFNKKYRKVPLRLEQTLFLMEKLPDSNKIYKDGFTLRFDLDVLIGDRGIAEKLIGVPKRLRGCDIARPSTPNYMDLFMKDMIKRDSEHRRRYHENKQKYQEQKQQKRKDANTEIAS